MLSQSGTRGKWGGDIRLSHAFDDSSICALYERQKGDRVLSPEMRCLFWKDSMRVTNHLAELGLRPEEVAARDARLRFVLPIRNPLDCAQGNLRKKSRLLVENESPTKLDLLERILHLIRDVSFSAAARPEAFFISTQSEMDRNFWSEICGFLNVDCPEDWLTEVSKAVKVRPGYEHTEEEKGVYRNLVRDIFEGDAEMRERLLVLV